MDEAQARSEMDSCQAQISQHQADIAAIDAKIKRLKTAYDQAGERGEGMRTLIFKYQSDLQSYTSWTGSLRRTFDDAAVSRLAEASNAYMNQLDAARDAIIDAITRLENEKASANGAIGWLQSRWNDLCGWLQKQFN